MLCPQPEFWLAVIVGASLCFHFPLLLNADLFGAAATGRAALARRPLLLQDRVDVIHFAQPLEERDEVQQLRVRHVIEPRGHGHLGLKINRYI